MFNTYYLVELSAMNPSKAVRSNCVLTTHWFQKPPIEIAFENFRQSGYLTINVMSCTKISKKTADYLKEYINGGTNVVSRETVDTLQNAVKEKLSAVQNPVS